MGGALLSVAFDLDCDFGFCQATRNRDMIGKGTTFKRLRKNLIFA